MAELGDYLPPDVMTVEEHLAAARARVAELTVQRDIWWREYNAVQTRLQRTTEALRLIGTSPWTEQDHPSAAYARSTLASLAGEDE